MERKNRCNYFKWADSTSDSNPDNQIDTEDLYLPSNSYKDQVIFEPMQIDLAKIFDEKDGSVSLQLQFCALIGEQFELLKDSIPESEESGNISVGPSYLFRTEEDILQDTKDGILQSKVKLGKHESSSAGKSSHVLSESIHGTTSLICESLHLFSLIASSQKWGSDEWYPVLCAIITGGSLTLRNLAKHFLQQLCGGNQELYHRIRDHYVYGYLFRNLLRQSEEVLDNALIVREMAKQCGSNWRDDEVEFKTLPAAGLIGVDDLVSEDCLSVTYERNLQQILDELLRTASSHTRKCNWKNFCHLSEIPADINRDGSSVNNTSIIEQLVHRRPMMSILWLGSCLKGSNQVKIFQLADIALANDEISSSTDEDEIKMGEGVDSVTPKINIDSLSVGDLHAFISEFVVNGRSKELRHVSARVAVKLASHFSDAERNTLISRLVDGLFRNVAGKFGRTCFEFIVSPTEDMPHFSEFCMMFLIMSSLFHKQDLLKQFVQSFDLDLSNVSSCVTSALVLQMAVTNHSAGKATTAADTRFDLANCVHCHSHTSFKKPEISSTKESETWIEEQLRPFAKSRLESSTLSSTHNEYSSFFQLKFRVVLSEVTLTVSDPRGRLVKNIGVYFSPRPVGEVSTLKSEKYNSWQRCGTLSLTRHATTATFKLKTPVVAANLKFTYEDFFEKAGSASNRASDGSFVLHCPRCTRQVNNAHGVCGNCGEVAFQCRKCR